MVQQTMKRQETEGQQEALGAGEGIHSPGVGAGL